MVPILAVSRIGGQYFVFVAENQDGKIVAHQKPLQVGDMVGNDYAVLDGIKAGDKVIVSGTEFRSRAPSRRRPRGKPGSRPMAER